MIIQDNELINIVTKLAESGWDLIDAPSKAWLESNHIGKLAEEDTKTLITVVEKADEECGSCGCEFDPLYKRALILLRGL